MTEIAPRLRVIIDNDFSGDPDGLAQLVHHLLSPSVEIVGIIGSHLRPGDPFDPSEETADNACRRIEDVLAALGRSGQYRVLAGSNTGMVDERTPVDSEASRAIVAEALRNDTELPLVIACGAGLTEVASAWLLDPRIAERLTVVWIGGAEDPTIAPMPPGAPAVEYNLAIDVVAARVVFNDSALPLWQVPRATYRQTLLSQAEAEEHIRPHGEVGRLVYEAIDQVAVMAGRHGYPLGETYIYGDSPLVLLTALRSSFESDPSSSEWVARPAPVIREDGTPVFETDGRTIRVYTRLDVRLMFEDFFAKLRRAARR
ncbi:nucleoside hydrolase [Galbitalea soli]|uniref:Nucleoside hydrolase n=1 Tax=Galbitalea soli TaxID=1268042 RepID=A0A7C9PP55_9MICO|nr:nucleoside hydrolase [Galbitalea soli]NEM92047.1 nucleoside hydrolase [Galbitalea soli]NYJ32001.1 inosine-uridine nucleoside N-ribohydrolase [Galbitalea soli]